MIRELWATLVDAWQEGDWFDHLLVWWVMATDQITPGTRAGWPMKAPQR